MSNQAICWSVLCISVTFLLCPLHYVTSFYLNTMSDKPYLIIMKGSPVTQRHQFRCIYRKVILVLYEHLIGRLNLPWLGSTHLRDPRTTSNPGSPSSSPHTPSALGSGISDPVLNGGLCSAAYCSSAGGRCRCRYRCRIAETESERENQSPGRELSGSHYGKVSRCHPAVVGNNGRAPHGPTAAERRKMFSSRVVMSQSTVMSTVF